MQVSDFNYELPEELIAQTPIKKRDESNNNSSLLNGNDIN